MFGNPIEQSKSPIIHSMFAQQCGIKLSYTKRLAPVDDFSSSANEFFEQSNAIGANVTMPFKHAAMTWVDKLSKQAGRAGAVNTIIRRNNKFIGDNTDGIGLVADLIQHEVELNEAKVLLIGAGGAAKGAVPALIEAGVRSVEIYNRSIDKAELLVAAVDKYANKKASLYQADVNQYDLIINATSLSLHGQIPDLPASIFTQQPAIYDMVYQSSATAFMVEAKKQACNTLVDGLGMLVNQAAESFYLWFDVRPDTNAVLEYLRRAY